MSKIEWTEKTWNCITGCTKISAGCKNCYAEKMTYRLKGMGQEKYVSGFDVVTTHEDALEIPLKWRKPRKVFVNSMSDTFHKDIPTEFILRMFNTMREAEIHQFQVLTKRSERVLELDNHLDWEENVWMGVTVEKADYVYRIDHLRQTGAVTKFLSMEPLLGPVPNLDLEGIHWVIVGGESGPGARPMHEEWVIDIRDQCLKQGVAFFFKQWGGVNKKKNGRELQGRTWDQYPDEDISEVVEKKGRDNIYAYIDCLTSEEKSILLKNIPESQLNQMFIEMNLL